VNLTATLYTYMYREVSRDSSVGIATSYGLDDRGVGVQAGSGAHPTSYPMGTGGIFPGGKADHLPPTSAEVKKMWIYTSNPHRLHGVVFN
jgi:hypothetical protein